MSTLIAKTLEANNTQANIDVLERKDIERNIGIKERSLGGTGVRKEEKIDLRNILGENIERNTRNLGITKERQIILDIS